MAEGSEWTRDELVLALDLYRREGMLGPTEREVIRLSKRIGRSEGAISKRLANFLALDGKGGLSNWSAGCKKVWDEFAGKPRRLRDAAARVTGPRP